MAKLDKTKKKKLSLRGKFKKVIKAINEKVLEMEDVVWGLMLAILSGGKLPDGRHVGEHLFMMGPPGCGKSYVMTTLFKCLTIPREQLFKNQLHAFSVPKEYIGDTDVAAFLKEHRNRTDTYGMFPEAVFAILDEIWKAGPVTSSFLTITNEREYKNGRETMQCPLITMVCASNEYPQDRDAALWDRILFRFYVDGNMSRENKKRLNEAKRAEWNPPKLSLEEILAAKEEVYNVVIPDEVMDAHLDVEYALAKLGIKLSLRTTEKQLNVIRANAWLNGRKEAIVEDVSSLVATCWRRHEEIPKVRKVITELTNRSLSKMLSIFDTAYALYTETMKTIHEYENKTNTKLPGVADAGEKLGILRDELEDLEGDSASNDAELRKMLAQIRNWHREVLPYAQIAAGFACE